MRLLGIALLAFVLAGASILLAGSDLSSRMSVVFGGLDSEPDLIFERDASSIEGQGPSEAFRMAGIGDPVLLTGVPAWQTVSFLLPLDVRPVSGTIEFRVTSQVLEGVEATLRVSIGGARRSDILLRPGHHQLQFRIDLSQADLHGRQLNVSFTLQGDGPPTLCARVDGRNVVVEIEQSSSLNLILDGRLETARDLLAAHGGVAEIPLSTDTAQSANFLLAARLLQHGQAIRFSDQPSTHSTLAELEELLRPEMDSPDQMMWPRAIAQGRNSGLRRFQRSTEWRIDLAGGGGGFIPGRVVLEFGLGARTGDAPWVLDISLDDQLIFSEELPAVGLIHSVDIDLTAHNITRTSELISTLSVFSSGHGPCNDVPERVAELRYSSHLVASDRSFSNPIAQLQSLILQNNTVAISGRQLTSPIDAIAASNLLAEVIPRGHIVGLSDTPTIELRFLPPGADLPSASLLRPAWAVWRDEATGQLNVEPISTAAREVSHLTVVLFGPLRPARGPR